VVEEFSPYIDRHTAYIPNYGEWDRNGGRISTGFVESTVNQVVSKRMEKRQQTRWTRRGTHLAITRQDRFEADVACPVGEVVVDVPEALVARPAHIPQLHVAGVRTVTTVVLAVDMEVIQMLATPREGDLQGIVEMRERSVAMGEETTPDERADASETTCR
jgi:hypothetical protein